MPYEPTFESLRQHPVPPWFSDAKFGIMVHWGPYSVPAWAERSGSIQRLWMEKGPAYTFKHNPYAEWYLNTMEIPGSETQRHHLAKYGARFQYDDFVPLFDGASAKMDPATWADLFARAGARYVVLTTKHHDGFLLWPSRHPNPHKPSYHSRRDIVGDVSEAVREHGLKLGLYYSGGYDKTFDPTVIRSLMTAISAIPQSRGYGEYVDAHVTELIDRYQPSILWNDIAYPAAGQLKQVLAHYYNTVPDGVINDRFARVRMPRSRLTRTGISVLLRTISLAWPALPRSFRRLQVQAARHHDFTTPEYTEYGRIVSRKWEAVRGLGTSFGNNREERPEDMLSVEELVRLLVDVVSKNGNLMLGIAPEPDGNFPALQRERILGVGDWLKVNGEAIYGTVPWQRPDGKTFDGLAVRLTCKGDTLFALLLGTPTGRQVVVEGLPVPEEASVCLLGHDQPLTWERQGSRLMISLPESLPASPAHAFRIQPGPDASQTWVRR